jgi:hypothetical protein
MAIITHKIGWDKCLSHQIWPAIEKGWKDADHEIHFFWGLAGNNLREIKECEEQGKEWWYVDVGYLTDEIVRYPEPKIVARHNTYFRIVKGGIHTTNFPLVSPDRLKLIAKKQKAKRNPQTPFTGSIEFKGWRSTRGEYVLVCPSSPTVTYHVNGITQEEWIDKVSTEIKKHTDLPIKIRNKPRPGNQWWNRHIHDDLNNAHCLVTNMSLAAIDAILHYTPVFCDKRNAAASVSSQDFTSIEDPFKPEATTVKEWIYGLCHNQFNLEEIENGTAYETLRSR